MLQVLNNQLTIEELKNGDVPDMPIREDRGGIKWSQISSVRASNINYGDFDINQGSLKIGAGDDVVIMDSNGIGAGSRLWSNMPWRVDMQGNMVANNVNLSGVVNATSGTIGGFTLTPTKMYGGVIETSNNVTTGGNGVIMDSAGLRGYSSLYGNTFNIPTNGSAPSFSSGTIQSTEFLVDDQAVIRTSETVGDGTSASAGVLINNDGIYAVAPNQTLDNANVRIMGTGQAYINASVRGGSTDFMTGVGYFLGINNGLYKLSIGDPSGNYMNWDGSLLRIKGNLDLTSPLGNITYTTASLPVPPIVTTISYAGGYE